MSENAVFVDFSVDCTEDEFQEYKGQPEGSGVMYPQNGTTIDLTATSESDRMSLDNIDDESVLTRAPIDNPKPYFKPAATTSYFSIYTPRTASISAPSPSSALAYTLTSSYKIHNDI